MKYSMLLTVFLAQCLFAQKYYPTAVGNEWYFDSSSTAFHVKVLSDSTFPNGKVYAVLNRSDFARGQYVRVDSLYVYYYFPSEQIDVPFFQLNGNVGDTTFAGHSWVTITKIDTTTVFHQPSRNIHYRIEDVSQIDIVLSEKFGLIRADLYNDPPPPWPDYVYHAVGCKIDGENFGFTLSVQGQEFSPRDFSLFQNYPNPFNPSTTIEYSLSSAAHVRLDVFDYLGKEIAVLVSEKLNAGNHNTHWDALTFSSGVYFYRLTVDNMFVTRKLILLR